MLQIQPIIRIIKILVAKDQEGTDRGNERYRKAFKTISGTYLAQLIGIITGIITTPLVLSYLGNERYGLMIAVTALFFFTGYLDLGFGIGIQNRISRAYGRQEFETATRYSSSGFFFYLVLALALAVVSFIVLPLLPLSKILKLETAIAGSEVLPTVLVTALTVAIGLISVYIQRLCDALQQGYLTRFALIFSRIASVCLIFLGVYLKVGLPVIVSFHIIPTVAMLFAYGMLVKQYPWMKPTWRSVDFSVYPHVISTGVQGLGALIAYSAMITTIPLIISNRLGAAVVISYVVSNQIMMLITGAINTISAPFWPAITEALATGDVQWVAKASKRFITISTGLALFSSVMFFLLGRPVIALWTRNQDAVPCLSLLTAMAVSMVLVVMNANLCMILNGMNRFTGQSVYGIAITLLTLAGAYFVGYRFGVAGIAWTLAIGYLLRCCCLFLELLVVRERKLYVVERVEENRIIA